MQMYKNILISIKFCKIQMSCDDVYPVSGAGMISEEVDKRR